MKQNRLYLPSTFEERGTAAPFTTPMFVLSRVRPDERHGLVLLLPSFVGTEGSYVVPWSAVQEIGGMSTHDRALHEEILAAKATSPDEMRAAAFKVAATGLAGPLAAESARQAIAADRKKIDETHILLILALLTSAGMTTRELTETDPETDEWRGKTKAMLTQAAGEYGTDIDQVYHRIGELSRALAPVGLAISRQEARLRQMLQRLGEFRQSIAEWAEQDVSDMAEGASFAAGVADLTLDLAGKMFRRLDVAVSDIGKVVRNWAAEGPQARRLAGRLSWLLDGWETVMELWRSVADQPVDVQRDGVTNLMRVLPLIPRSETEDDGSELGRRCEIFRHTRLQAHVDWRTGKYDVELVSRIEQIKARATA
ncbi:hypothetical protein GCM10011611_19130 [Aliidongia dinghuensis]|uniref:Uncharacterized protein n=1 Tax=Aliidongia dinghuensis TaxID=1867774 RepID=A0A8J2YRV7_9PROT|nr:hypothetical protein [Aliidongia dinghuensis]GGF13580.1 hypothetical protein GCM10011611_19130 [Aliidongia dinghuensis]